MTDDAAKLGPADRHRIARFWRQLKLAIPNRRRKTAPSDDAAQSAAAAATPRQESADTDSPAKWDVDRRLLRPGQA